VANAAVNPEKPHDHLKFHYTRRQMDDLGAKTGWIADYFGDWNHPRHSKMMLFSPVWCDC